MRKGNLHFKIIIVLFLLITGCQSSQYTIEKKRTYASLDRVVHKLYGSLTYKKDSIFPGTETIRSCFVSSNSMLMEVKDEEYTKYTLEEYLTLFKESLNSGGYKSVEEYELSNTKEMFGDIAHVMSIYNTRVVLEGGDIIEKRGINSIQLIKADNDWKIVSIIWYDEDEKNKLTGDYLNFKGAVP